MQVPMQERPVAEYSQATHELLRKLSEQDRDVMEKAVKAFVSFVRAYKEHYCKFIFRLADLDLAQLATALGLLRLPKMPEMRKTKQRLQGFTPSLVDPNDVKVLLRSSTFWLSVQHSGKAAWRTDVDNTCCPLSDAVHNRTPAPAAVFSMVQQHYAIYC